MGRIAYLILVLTCAMSVVACDPCAKVQCIGEQTCSSGVCIDPECGEGLALDPAKHICVDACSLVNCVGDQTCKNGQCIDPECSSFLFFDSLAHVCIDLCDNVQCGADEYCSQGTCLKIPDFKNFEECVSFQGSNDSLFKVLFVQINDVSYFNELLNQIVHDEFRDIEPFRSTYDEITMYKLSLNIENIEDYCQGVGGSLSGSGFACDDNLIKQSIQEKCPNIDPNDFIILVFVESEYGGSGGEIIYAGVNSSRDVQTEVGFKKNLAVHEIGHNMGLADLYYGMLYFDGSPSQFWPTDYSRSYYNVDGPGCSKWCESYKPVSEYTESGTSACLQQKTKEACVSYKRDSKGYCQYDGDFPACCVWSDEKFEYFETNCVPAIGSENIGIDCVGDSGCYFGACYGNYAWRPVLSRGDSIMYDLSAEVFDDVSKRHLQQVIDCCYKQDNSSQCQEFRVGFNEFLRNNGFKKKLGMCE